MTQQHPITPPHELVNQWKCALEYQPDAEVFSQAARWGADQELEACVNWLLLNGWGQAIDRLRAARRPKPPSLKEQALKQLECVDGILRNQGMIKTDTIRRALEALPDD